MYDAMETAVGFREGGEGLQKKQELTVKCYLLCMNNDWSEGAKSRDEGDPRGWKEEEEEE